MEGFNFVNIIIILLIAVALFFGIRFTIKHFSHKGGCCGGGGYKLKKKKLPQVIATKVFRVEGMHCENCKKRVEEVVNDIHGIAGSVDLKKEELTVSYAEEVSDEIIVRKIERAGYKLINID